MRCISLDLQEVSMKWFRKPLVLLLMHAPVVVLGGAANATATPINASAIGLASPVSIITFDEHVLAANTPLTNQYADLDVTFSPNLFYSPQTGGFPNING